MRLPPGPLRRAVLAELPPALAAATPARRALTIAVLEPAESPEGPFTEGVSGVSYCLDGGRLMLRAPAGLRVEVDPNCDTIRLLEPTGGAPAGDLAAAMATALPYLLRGPGCHPLHAAMMVPPGNAGVPPAPPSACAPAAVLLVGLSGAGKSTLAAALMRLGWSLLADDLVLLRGERPEAMGWPRRPRLRPGTVRRFAALRGPLSADAQAAAVPRPCRLIVFPRITAGRPTWTAVGPREALSGIIPCSLLPGDAETVGEHFRTLGLLARTPAGRLDSGSDPITAARLIAELMG